MPDTLETTGGGRYPSDMESRVTALEHIARTTAAALERLERRFDAVDRRFETMDRRIDALTSEHRADFRWTLGIMLGGFSALLGVMARGFHWL
jgi:hypothetical protein